MQYGQIPGIDKPLSRLVQGTVPLSAEDLDGAFLLLDTALANGCNVLDTAHHYGLGESERTIGMWLESRDNRDEVVIISKGAHPSIDRKRVTAFDIASDLHDSLARLHTDYIDLYLLHRDDPEKPVGPIIEVLNEHQAAGRIRAFGGSNWTPKRLQEANDYAEAHGLTPFAASSPQFSLAEVIKEPWPGCLSIGGEANRAAREWYQANQMPLFTWSSLASGFMTGRITRDLPETPDTFWDEVAVAAYACEANFKRLDRAKQMADEKKLTVSQVALAYVMNSPLNLYAITGARTLAEFIDNLYAAEVELSPEEMAWLLDG